MRNTLFSLTMISILIGMLIFSCQPNVSIETAQYAVNGQKLYVTHCQNCHGAKGEGLGMLYPPLTDTTVPPSLYDGPGGNQRKNL